MKTGLQPCRGLSSKWAGKVNYQHTDTILGKHKPVYQDME